MIAAKIRAQGCRVPEPPTIEVGFYDLDELFDNLDPAPREARDLDLDAEEYIVSWATELPGDKSLTLVVHLPPDQRPREAERIVPAAIRRFFTYKAEMAGREFALLLRRGRISLVIGLAFMAGCSVLSSLIETWLTGAWAGRFGQVLSLGLQIMGWVALWRPLELLLYDWWPVAARQRTYRRLADMTVSVRYDREGLA